MEKMLFLLVFRPWLYSITRYDCRWFDDHHLVCRDGDKSRATHVGHYRGPCNLTPDSKLWRNTP